MKKFEKQATMVVFFVFGMLGGGCAVGTMKLADSINTTVSITDAERQKMVSDAASKAAEIIPVATPAPTAAPIQAWTEVGEGRHLSTGYGWGAFGDTSSTGSIRFRYLGGAPAHDGREVYYLASTDGREGAYTYDTPTNTFAEVKVDLGGKKFEQGRFASLLNAHGHAGPVRKVDLKGKGLVLDPDEVPAGGIATSSDTVSLDDADLSYRGDMDVAMANIVFAAGKHARVFLTGHPKYPLLAETVLGGRWAGHGAVAEPGMPRDATNYAPASEEFNFFGGGTCLRADEKIFTPK